MSRKIWVWLVIGLFLNWPLVNALEISNVRAEEITENSAIVKWETDEAADGFVSYGSNKSELTTTGEARETKEHSFGLTGLLNSTDYFFKVKSKGIEDNKGGNFYSFKTLVKVLDNTPPEINLILPEVISEDRINIKGETEAGAEVRLKVNDGLAGVKEAVGENFSFIEVKLKANSLNKILVEAKDKAGNIGSKELKVLSDTARPKIELKGLPAVVTDSKIKLEGTISENASLEILLNNQSVHKKETELISVEINLVEGNNTIKAMAVDKAGLQGEAEAKTFLDTKPPAFKEVKLVGGTSYYQGRAKTDIVGEVKAGAKVYLYFFKRAGYQSTPDFGRAYEMAVADKEGKFTFKEVNFEMPPLAIEKLAPKEIPASLKEVVIPPYEVLKEQQRWAYEVYLIAEDSLGRVTPSAWKQVVTIETCYTSEYAFHVDTLPQFQMPYRLDPTMMTQGRQIISAIINLSYVGGGVAVEGGTTGKAKETFKVNYVKLERACSPEMVDQGDFKVSCKILPGVLSPTANPTRTAWFLQAQLMGSEELSKVKDDFWNDFKNRQLKFPLKMIISYQDVLPGGKLSETKTQTSCFDLGYFVDIPLDSKKMIPDFLAEEGVSALNWTIEAIDTVIPYLQTAITVGSIGCGVSILIKMATRWYRLFMSKFEPVLTKFTKLTASGEGDKACPSGEEQGKLVLKSTIDGWVAGKGPAVSDKQILDNRCPMTANAWKAEAALQTALRWTCDRVLCHQAPAKWTEGKTRSEITAVKLREQSCGSYAARGIPLREIEDCRKEIEKNPKQFVPTIVKSKEFQDLLKKASGNTCYVDSSTGEIYYVNLEGKSETEKEKLEREGGLWPLKQVGSRLTFTKVGEIATKSSLVAYKPKGAKDFIVGIDTTCKKVCEKRSGFKPATSICDKGCCEVKEDGSLTEEVQNKIKTKGEGEIYPADYTRDCFPKTEVDKLKTCVCEKAPLKAEAKKEGVWPRVAEPGEEWSYHQAQVFQETGGNAKTCTGGKAGTCYPTWRYYSGRDLSAAFGQNSFFDYFRSGKEEVTEVNPFTGYLDAWQALCISQIHNQLRMLQTILVGMKNCLIEAKYKGVQNAGMCKELFSQQVCGLLYKLIAYAAKGCWSVPFFSSDKGGDESVWGAGIKSFLGSMQGTLQTTMNDLKAEYGNAKLNEYFSIGVQGVTKQICLAMFGYDVPIGLDMIRDAAYALPMKTTTLVVPAEKELISYNPMKGTAIYNYRVGASLFPGCKVRSYRVKLKCVGQEDMGKENVHCPDPVQESCPCLYAGSNNPGREYPLYSSVEEIKKGTYHTMPIPSPTRVDSLFRYDHAIVELELDRFEDPTKCFDKQYIEGNKGVFYTPLTDVSVKPIVACKVDPKTGTFTCPEMSEIFGVIGNTYLEPPFVECWNERKKEWMSCESINNFIKGEMVRIRPLIYSDGKKQCLHITLTGMPDKRIYPVGENMGPLVRPPIDLIPVDDQLLGGAKAGIASKKQENANCGVTPIGAKIPDEIKKPQELTFKFIKDITATGENKYELKIEPQAICTENRIKISDATTTIYNNYDIDKSCNLIKKGTTINKLTLSEINEAEFLIEGNWLGGFGGDNEFVIKNVIGNIVDAGKGGLCRYEIRSEGKASQSAKELTLTLELKHPDEGGDCTTGTKALTPPLGSATQTVRIKVQKEELLSGTMAGSELHNYWKAGRYSVLLDSVIMIINSGRGDLENVITHYYAVATNVMLGQESKDATTKSKYWGEAKKYIKLFKDKEDEQNTGYKAKGITSQAEYVKIKKYMEVIETDLVKKVS